MSRHFHVTVSTRPEQLADKTLAAIDRDEVVWIGRRKAPAIMEAAEAIVTERRPGLGLLKYRDRGESFAAWTSRPGEVEGVAYFTTARSERYRLAVDEAGDVVAVPER